MGLQGSGVERPAPDTPEFDEQSTLRRMQEGGYRSGVAIYYIYKSQAHLLNRDFPAAIRMAERAAPYLHSLIGLPDTAEVTFFHALALASQTRRAVGFERLRCRAALQPLLARLKRWSRHCPANFAARYALVRAEQAAAAGRQQRAMRLFEQAINTARENELTQIEAMANEWAAYFHQRNGFRNIALGYLRAARKAYLRWGATPKAEALKQTLLEWDPTARTPDPAPAEAELTAATNNMQLDLATAYPAP